ncbi:MAG: 50S ribosomal protein L22 [Candidatus Melainabacteria bacterium LEY3_CP_29_8]|nr:MAG: 50S ribosomal protein L22 [Candidatus Melainabacteria bacterium LEY3_CP_29_8]
MEAKARQTNIKMPARKLRRVINEVRGKSCDEAIKILKFMPYFAAKVVEKNLIAAIANANEKLGVGSSNLKISEIFADESVTYKRARPRAQGRMYKRFKRTSHLTLKVMKIK